jgi:hypothetical protein
MIGGTTHRSILEAMMEQQTASKSPHDEKPDPLDAPYILRRKNQNPTGSWTFTPRIRVKPGTDLMEMLRRSRDGCFLADE